MNTNLFILLKYAYLTKSEEDILAVIYEANMRCYEGKLKLDAKDSIVNAMVDLLTEVRNAKDV